MCKYSWLLSVMLEIKSHLGNRGSLHNISWLNGRNKSLTLGSSEWFNLNVTAGRSELCLSVPYSLFRAGLLSTPVHCADSPVSSGQPQHCPSRQTLRGVRGPQQRGVEQVPERLQGGCSNTEIKYFRVIEFCQRAAGVSLTSHRVLMFFLLRLTHPPLCTCSGATSWPEITGNCWVMTEALVLTWWCIMAVLHCADLIYCNVFKSEIIHFTHPVLVLDSSWQYNF